MPRDLESEKATLEGMPPLSKEPDARSPLDSDPLPLYRIPTSFVEDRFKRMKDLHPYALLLNRDDIEESDWLEHACFEPHEAASREKVGYYSLNVAILRILRSVCNQSYVLRLGFLEYRLAVCGELCSGLFSSAYATTDGKLGELVRTRQFPSLDSKDSDRRKVLLGHVIATKHAAFPVTDDAMDYPKDWRTNYQLTPSIGHNEDGETICLHSLCVHPDFQRKGLGGVLLRGWSQRIKDSGIGKRIALICRERLISWYEKAGFKLVGESKCQYGGGGWFDMVMEFDDVPSGDMEF
ncbi:hypothetical protein BDV96DRAFT_496268 [Lophiotrema nucula]|uniref:N-acetyltransferase domain-containing protein n=1 Tax=Lophiotrema nucula TaxID=690887 RepID=A0A6A5Z1J6_9PLEO|nr:hypothetical protein BDV96DRAFT_496268 [Lophiotrema nucula]